MPMLSHVKFHKLQKISGASLNTIAAFSLTTESVDDQPLDVVCHLFHHIPVSRTIWIFEKSTDLKIWILR